jgi:hypothetical protein
VTVKPDALRWWQTGAASTSTPDHSRTTRNAATGYAKPLEPALPPNSTDVRRPHSDRSAGRPHGRPVASAHYSMPDSRWVRGRRPRPALPLVV